MTKAYKVHYISRIFFLVALLINIYIALDVDILYGTLYIFLNIILWFAYEQFLRPAETYKKHKREPLPTRIIKWLTLVFLLLWLIL